MLEQLKLLLNFDLTDDSQDALLSLLLDMTQQEIVDFCNLSAYKDSMNHILLQMCVEKFNKMGSEGLNSSSVNGAISESYNTTYSEPILLALRRNRRLKMV